MFRSVLSKRANARFHIQSVRRFLSGGPGGKSRVYGLIGGATVLGAVSGSIITKKLDEKCPSNGSFPLTSTTALADIASPEYLNPAEVLKGLQEIEAIIGKEHVSVFADDLEARSDSFSNSHKPKPDEKPFAVVFPGSTEDVSEILKICHKYRIPVVPYSGGTSLEGHYVQTRKGLSLDMSRMDKILQFNKDDLDVVCEPGVGWQDLNAFLEPHGLMIGVDPGPGAQLGGMSACSCSGTNAFNFGTMKENVIGLEVVLADGTVIKTRQRPKKTSAGYNLTGLFIGSEGTLGVVTKVIMKLHVKPKNESITAITFPTIEDANTLVSNLIQSGIKLNAVEFLNTEMVKCLNESKQLSSFYVEKPTLLLKIGGLSPAITKETLKQVKAITSKSKAISYKFAYSDQEKDEIWQARKLVLWSSIEYGRRKLGPDANVLTTDAAVPISDLPQMIKDTQDDIDENGLLATVLGHVGDGNFHVLLVYNNETLAAAKAVADRIVERAVVKYDGTCTGEHGVGMGKRQYLLMELGQETIDTMRRLKLSLDPLRILNPDKIFKIDPADSDH